MTRIIALIIGLMIGAVRCAPAQAMDVHPDYRFGSGECPTWKGAAHESVSVWARVFEQYDFTVSNYPIHSEYRFVCQYKGDPDPVSSKPGEYVWKIASSCFAKTVLVDGMPRTSYPLLTAGYSTEYNEGWSYGQVWCKYDPWYYNAPPAPTTTTTMAMP